MYRKKVVQRGEKHSEIDVEKPSANRFASLADSDVQFKRTNNYGEIFDYLHEKGMMKVATQSQIKEVPAKPKQTLKNFEKAHKTKTKKKSTQTCCIGIARVPGTYLNQTLHSTPSYPFTLLNQISLVFIYWRARSQATAAQRQGPTQTL
ncbi:Hypothetical_protein [Hexamita inflata]|uniref:Hypothetical_protein n=1 Tax=Hexamita inflata TaxID=28002 RepID=A0AA86UZB7_9EUKA|nr:Hypothetical protein HINF_LOCUS57947 [Hexamita inflata]